MDRFYPKATLRWSGEVLDDGDLRKLSPWADTAQAIEVTCVNGKHWGQARQWSSMTHIVTLRLASDWATFLM
jgi:hypothetical protein